MTDRMVLAPQVEEALARRRPVVALETTVVTHGLPGQEGRAAALELEQAVRESGAVPATIGVLDGAIRVGLSEAELDRLAQGNPVKANPANLAAAVASGSAASTTVAATAWIAAACGIRVLATGGIGGVHRGYQESADVSADLAALARHAVAVVCSGAKAVLDLPRTLEMLESAGVPVYGHGTADLPAFYRRTSGLALDARFDHVEDLARACRVHWSLGGAGIVVGHPVPAEHEMPRELYEGALERALAESRKAAVRGRELTPFLLERMRVLTEGRSVFTNLALLRSNASLAARLSAAIEPSPWKATVA